MEPNTPTLAAQLWVVDGCEYEVAVFINGEDVESWVAEVGSFGPIDVLAKHFMVEVFVSDGHGNSLCG
jgi:hypothetical protein